MDTQTLPAPPVMWAQRTSCVFLTINLEDSKDPDIKVNKDSVYFKGHGGVEQKEYEITIPLYKEIDPDKSKVMNRGRMIEIFLSKANKEEPYWPYLTSDKKKHHWLKCDFNKWHDEEESGDEGIGDMDREGGGDFDEMVRLMGGVGCDKNKPNVNDLNDTMDSDDEEESSAEEDPSLPDLI